MIEFATNIEVVGITAKQIFDFMIDCDDERYHDWWPEEHFRFHTVKHVPGYVGNIVYFDEMIGERRIKSYAVIRQIEKNNIILLQMRSVVPVPVWVKLKIEENENSITITHTMKIGFNGVGKLLDAFFKIFVSERFEDDLNKHVLHEFKLLAKQLASA